VRLPLPDHPVPLTVDLPLRGRVVALPKDQSFPRGLKFEIGEVKFFLSNESQVETGDFEAAAVECSPATRAPTPTRKLRHCGDSGTAVPCPVCHGLPLSLSASSHRLEALGLRTWLGPRFSGMGSTERLVDHAPGGSLCHFEHIQ
jgi:hypothetical protein